MALIDSINLAGTTVVMATHDRSIVDKMQRRVVELSQGQIIRDQASGGYGVRA
jgi:cell division transport system ATP-binding protein